MTILCATGCHVYRVGCSACTCGQNLTKFPLSGGTLNGYNPYGPPRPPTPPTAGEAPLNVSIRMFKAAQDAGATHLSADGARIYTTRYGETLEAEWKERLRAYGAWSVVKEMPADAVAM